VILGEFDSFQGSNRR